MSSGSIDKTKRITIIASVMLTVIFALAFIFDLYPRIRKEAVVKGITEYKNEEVDPNGTTIYRFEHLRSAFDTISFFVADGDPTSLTVSLERPDDKTLVLKNVRITDEMCFPEGSAKAIRLVSPDNSRFEPGLYSIIISNSSRSPVTVVIDQNSGSLIVRLIVKTNTGRDTAFLVAILLIVLLVLSVCLYLKNSSAKKISVETVFLITVIPLCAAFLILIPPWSTGDSEAHYLACYRLSNLFLGQSGNAEWMGRTDDVTFFRDIWWNATPPSTGGYEILKSNFSLFASGKDLIRMTSTSEKMNYYSVFCYIPQTAALVAGRLIGFGSVMNCYLAKISTAVFYIFFCYRAVRKAPYGKEIIALCALLPSSLMMSSAFSYDPMVIITSLNFIASVLLLKDCPDNRKHLIFACIWAFILGAVKGGGYMILLPLLFLVPAKKKGIRHLGKLLPFISCIISLIIFDLILPDRGLFQFGSKGNGFMTASFALENPVAYLIMTVKTYFRFAADMLSDLFGSKLCWGEKTIPFAFSIVMFLVLLCLAAMDKKTDLLKGKDLIVMAVVVLIALLSTPAMLLSWTPEGSDVILGIQGHYYLPVLPLLVLILGKGIRSLAVKTGVTRKKAFRSLSVVPYYAALFMMFFALYFMMRVYLSR